MGKNMTICEDVSQRPVVAKAFEVSGPPSVQARRKSVQARSHREGHTSSLRRLGDVAWGETTYS